MLTTEFVRSILRYVPETGKFFWLVNTQGRANRAGGEAGHVNQRDGRVTIGWGGKKYLAHRLAFVWMGEEVPSIVDHKNRNPNDNRWENLRAATGSQNCANKRLRSDNSHGCHGIRLDKNKAKLGRKKIWQARINVNGRQISLKYHETKERAAQAYTAAAKQYFGEFSPV